jgi:hypothetical protein
MASLRVIPYEYVPTKRQHNSKHERSSVDKQPSAHRNKQQGELGLLPEKVLQSSIAETPGDAFGAGEKSRYDNVYETIADKPARRGIQDLASVPSAEVSLSGGAADQDTLGGETGYSQVEFTGRLNYTAGKTRGVKLTNVAENGTVDIDPLSDFDSIFGDIDALFEEQEVSSVIECNNGQATNPQTDASAGQIDSLVSEKEFGKSDTLGSSSPQLMRRRTNTKRRRGEG